MRDQTYGFQAIILGLYRGQDSGTAEYSLPKRKKEEGEEKKRRRKEGKERDDEDAEQRKLILPKGIHLLRFIFL